MLKETDRFYLREVALRVHGVTGSRFNTLLRLPSFNPIINAIYDAPGANRYLIQHEVRGVLTEARTRLGIPARSL